MKEAVYDFANRLTKTRRDHTATPPGGTLKTYTIREEYVYDHASRPRFARHKINTNNWVVTSAPVYDELNRLADKRLHASNYDGTSAVTLSSNFDYLQSLDYTYNVRSWLTGINNVASCSVQSGDQLADMFSMSLEYENSSTGGTVQYNGNIATIQWNTYINSACGTRQLYRFSYDAANRLTAAAHRTWSGSAWTDPVRYNESNITYDLNGNLKTYNRQGLVSGTSTFGTIDNLTYYFDDVARPDRLTRVVDAGNATKGFKYNASASSPHYTYDSNGNLTLDKHKDLGISYNYLNLPNYFYNSGGADITLTYTADGEKLTKVSSAGTRNYVAGIEYIGANLDAIYHAEGRCTPNGATAFYYEYTLKDHLGNARVNFRANGTAVTFLEEMHYYPFGMLMEGIGTTAVTVNKYKYNGKELNEDLGLNWSDYGARWYDAAVGRWWSVDPMAEKYLPYSLYAYVLNNPMIFIDPTGMSLASATVAPGGDIENDKIIQVSGPKNQQNSNGNNIYVLTLKGADKDVIKDLKKTLEQFIKDANLTTNVVMVNDPENFDITKIQVTDAVAVVGGDKNETAEFILKNLDKGYLSDSYKDIHLAAYLKSPTYINPEVSDRGPQGWGYVIATTTKNHDQDATGQWSGSVTEKFHFLNMTDAVAFTILHGMGHNAGIYHEIPGANDGGDQGFMEDGNYLPASIASFNGNISAFIKDTVSKYPTVIEKLQNRFKPIKTP